MFIIAMVLLCDVILSNELETFYNEAQWLETNANDYKQIPSIRGSRMCMFGWKKNMYKSSATTYGR